MQIDIDARVTDSQGTAIGQLNEIIFERESRRVAGFHVIVDGAAPREVFLMVGQVGQIAQDELTLALAPEEIAALPDARQHLFVAPGQDLDAEIVKAESADASADRPDPDERPSFSAIPGIALTANLLIPLEVERAITDEGQLALRAGLRVLAAEGEELGTLVAVVVNEEAQLESLILGGEDALTIDYTLFDLFDEDANELTLLPGTVVEAVPAGEEAAG